MIQAFDQDAVENTFKKEPCELCQDSLLQPLGFEDIGGRVRDGGKDQAEQIVPGRQKVPHQPQPGFHNRVPIKAQFNQSLILLVGRVKGQSGHRLGQGVT